MKDFYVAFTATSLVGPDYSDTTKDEIEEIIIEAEDNAAAQVIADGLKKAVLERHPSIEDEAEPGASADDMLVAEVMPLDLFLEIHRSNGRDLVAEASDSH